MKRSPGGGLPQKERTGRNARHFLDPGLMTLTVKAKCKTEKRKVKNVEIKSRQFQPPRVDWAKFRARMIDAPVRLSSKLGFVNARSQSDSIGWKYTFSQVIGSYFGIRYSQGGWLVGWIFDAQLTRRVGVGISLFDEHRPTFLEWEVPTASGS